MYLLRRATSLAKTGAAREETIKDIMGENRGAFKRLNCMQAGLGKLQDWECWPRNSDGNPSYTCNPLKRAMAMSPPIFWDAGTMVIPSCYYLMNYVAPDSHDEQ
jgi:hypothetical protein